MKKYFKIIPMIIVVGLFAMVAHAQAGPSFQEMIDATVEIEKISYSMELIADITLPGIAQGYMVIESEGKINQENEQIDSQVDAEGLVYVGNSKEHADRLDFASDVALRAVDGDLYARQRSSLRTQSGLPQYMGTGKWEMLEEGFSLEKSDGALVQNYKGEAEEMVRIGDEISEGYYELAVDIDNFKGTMSFMAIASLLQDEAKNPGRLAMALGLIQDLSAQGSVQVDEDGRIKVLVVDILAQHNDAGFSTQYTIELEDISEFTVEVPEIN